MIWKDMEGLERAKLYEILVFTLNDVNYVLRLRAKDRHIFAEMV